MILLAFVVAAVWTVAGAMAVPRGHRRVACRGEHGI
jgi:hypothetical protein